MGIFRQPCACSNAHDISSLAREEISRGYTKSLLPLDRHRRSVAWCGKPAREKTDQRRLGEVLFAASELLELFLWKTPRQVSKALKLPSALCPRVWLVSAEAQRVPNGAEERGRSGNQVLAACWSRAFALLQHADNVCRRNASANPVHRDEAHSAIGCQDENRWLGNASFFVRVVNVPFLHDATLAVGQDGKW